MAAVEVPAPCPALLSPVLFLRTAVSSWEYLVTSCPFCSVWQVARGGLRLLGGQSGHVCRSHPGPARPAPALLA